MPVIDGLRLLAILPVVFQHLSERVIRIAEVRHTVKPFDYVLFNILPTGGLGVELFFVISGLIISYPFVSAHFKQSEMPELKAFYLRRITRLEPPYFLIMIACYLFVRWTGYIPEGTLAFSRSKVSLETSLGASLIYMHGLVLGTKPILNPPAWSLELEIQFYIIAPLVLLSILRLSGRTAVFTTLVLFVVGIYITSEIFQRQFSVWPAFLLTKVFHLFAVGIIINVITLGGLVPRRISHRVWDITFVVSGTALLILDKHRGSMLVATLQIFCFVLFVLAALNGNVFREFLSQPWIFAIGGMCYTIYLIHLPILHVLTGILMKTTGLVNFVPGMIISTALLLPILFFASVAFYLLIEKPCMNPKWPIHLWKWVYQLMRPAGSVGP